MNTASFLSTNKFSQVQTDNINIIIKECDYYNISDDRQIAYILATTKHETGNTFLPVKEIGSVAYFIKLYWLNSRVAKWLGNINSADAAKYFGRGYTQITGKGNYEKFGKILSVDLLNNPDLALTSVIAAKIMVYGMKYGAFTGVRLDNYFNKTIASPITARKIINSLDKASLIASYYTSILISLRAA